jgi:hypothetical protein
MYIPKPINTDEVTLPEELLALSEQIAENTHEVWAAGRMADGWQYGPTRDDLKKTHPCLVPYGELSERERDFDRATSIETLKLVVALGYRIVKE